MYELPGTDSRERTLIELLSALLALCRLHFRSLHRPAWRDQAAVGISRGEMEHVKRRSAATLHQHHRWLKIAQRRVIK
jgi:hypothetical protein